MSDEFYQVTADKFIFSVKKDLLYAENDVWVKGESGFLRVGVTDFFQRRGGDIVFIELPNVGDKIERSGEIARLETIKAVLSVTSPFEGTVSDINPQLNDEPELINEDPYGEGWIIILSPSTIEEDMKRLLTAEGYYELMKSKIRDELRRSGRG